MLISLRSMLKSTPGMSHTSCLAPRFAEQRRGTGIGDHLAGDIVHGHPAALCFKLEDGRLRRRLNVEIDVVLIRSATFCPQPGRFSGAHAELQTAQGTACGFLRAGVDVLASHVGDMVLLPALYVDRARGRTDL